MVRWVPDVVLGELPILGFPFKFSGDPDLPEPNRATREVWGLFEGARRSKRLMVTHAGIVGQMWRQPSRQARLAVALIGSVEPLTDPLAKAVRKGRWLAAGCNCDS